MLTLAICDDSKEDRQRMVSYIDRMDQAHDLFTVKEFENGLNLLVNDLIQYDIVLLDIQMKWMDGMEVARRIRAADSELCIIFVTNTKQYAIEGYSVRAYQYLMKPIEYNFFQRVLINAAQAAMQNATRKIVCKTEEGLTCLDLRFILYFEAQGHCCIAHLKDKAHRCFAQIGEVERRLSGKGFVRCHKGYLVNQRHVVQLLTDGVRMSDNSLLAVSRHRIQHVIDRLTEYWGDLI